MKKKKDKYPYPRCRAEGLTVIQGPPIDYIPRDSMCKWEKTKSKAFVALFAKYYGVQTQCEFGPYPWDVEAVLERIYSGRLIWSQKDWD